MSLLLIFFQDLKERKVYLWLFIVVGICSVVLHYQTTYSFLFFYSLLFNLVVIATLLLVLSLYLLVRKKQKLKDVMGGGDILFLAILATTFSSISFLVLLVCSLVFSLSIHLLFTFNNQKNTVPLAGYMSLFFALVYLGHWLGFNQTLYSI